MPNDSSATGDNLDFGNIPQGNIWGAKYYDANLNGQYDVGEVLISGWTLKQGTTPFTTGSPITPADGNGFAANFLRTLDPGTYMFSEVQATNSWIQTGNTADQTFKTGGATALLGPNLSPAVPAFAYRITVPNDQPSSVSKVYFGNVCLAGGGGLTMGWWSNQNGQKGDVYARLG